MILIAMMTVILVVCAWVTIPFGIPLTLQTFGVFCALLLLGGKKGTIAIALYIILGIIGVPVFSGFSGGFGVILGATGGYILGFLLMGMIYWLFLLPMEKGQTGTSCDKKESGWKRLIHGSDFLKIAVLIVGLVVCYAFGTLWFVFMYSSGSGRVAFGTALSICVVPYIIPDLVKLVLAYLLCGRLVKIMRRTGELN